MSEIDVQISDRIATITFNRPHALNAITADGYDKFAEALREIDKRDDVLITVWQATGKWFCAGTDVNRRTNTTKNTTKNTIRKSFTTNVSRTTTDVGHALYSHRKILVAALNGPVMGISAAFLGYFDFIYAMPNVWLMTPFTFLGIIAEGGSSASFVNRMGLAKANEALIWGKKIEAQDLLSCGFLNKILPAQSVPDFHASIRALVLSELAGLDPTALLVVKHLLKTGLKDKNDPDAVNLRESYAQAERFASGVPGERFRQLAAKEIRHKL
ncbi:ClpP/crotonase [Athelia psychrophila]|uniref:ClpP/crotonase n=1 Tax=Athelia psychrophila TaxID=1759441 RepID=A0A166NBM7_9AGAM|nr:ClpP/crotonase [Fibularhizoctonia sp. CBS 109695]